MERDTERLGRLTAALQAANLDALFCRLPRNVLLLTGYWPVLGASTALLTREGALALLLPEDERELATAGWVTDQELLPFTPITLQHLGNADEATRPLLAEVGQRLGLTRAAIGDEAGLELVPAPYVSLATGNGATRALYQAALPEARFQDATELLRDQCAVLTARELAAVRHACAVAAGAFDAAVGAIRPGVREDEVAAAARARLELDGLADGQARRAGGWAFCMSGPRAAEAYRAYALTGTRVLQRGDFVLVHVNSYIDGFWTDLTRTYLLGDPGSYELAMLEAVLEARARALRAIQPGASAAAVDAAAREPLTRAGFGAAFKHGLGHGVGFGAIYHGNLPRLHPRSPDRLATGMVFNVEPAIYLDGVAGLRHCDVVATAASGARLFSPFHASLGDLILAG